MIDTSQIESDLVAAVHRGDIVSFGFVVVLNDGTVERTASCREKRDTTQLHGAIQLLAKGAMDFHERTWPPTLTPVVP
jgi:phage head maturation protease